MLSGKQRNYVKTRIWQIVSEIIKLARENYATIVIEDIKHLRVRKGKINKKARRKINRIPYGFFRFALEHKAIQEGIKVIAINPKYTSQTYPRCGKRRKSTQHNYFRCKCGFEANRDRVASQKICLRASRSLPSMAQYPEAGAVVNQPVWSYES
ncbi:MAG: IS200/IS605 family accessory protein TnpB-related protein, partial [Candidatus Asgardarchaeia archaeon]